MISSPPPAPTEDQGLTFTPPLWTQRLDFVRTTIFDLDILEVCDLGCGSGKLLTQLKEARCTRLMIGVDIDKHDLESAWESVNPDFQDYHFRRSTASTLRLYHGDILSPSPSLPYQIQCVTLCEVIEHIHLSQVPTLTDIIFHHINPKYCIVTTPNSDFNVNFNHVGFRHPDHKFEWTRKEFRSWVESVGKRYKYEIVSITGVGNLNNDTGFCTQIAIFRRFSSNFHQNRLETGPKYDLYREITYPMSPELPLKDVFTTATIYNIFAHQRHCDLEGNELDLREIFQRSGEIQAICDGQYPHFVQLLGKFKGNIWKKSDEKVEIEEKAGKVKVKEEIEEENSD